MHIYLEEFQKYSKKVSDLLERGHSYKEREEYGPALECYLQSMQNYVEAMDYFEKFERVSQRLDRQSKVYYVESPELDIGTLTTLERLSRNITVCYLAKNDVQKASYFIDFLEEISKAFAEFKSRFNVSQKEFYNEFIEHIELIKAEKSTKEAADIKPIPGFLSDKGDLEILIPYYNDQFDKTVEAVVKMQSLWVSGLRKDDDNFAAPNNSGACFIATAAYATEQHPDIDTFRKFRDSILLTNIMGRLPG